jgi:nitrogen fixation/metabolism regulation signal transduction histidine kinase
MAQTAEAAAPPRPSGKSQRKLRNYLLNLRYQLRYTMTIVGISLCLTGGLGYMVMSKAHEASRVVQVRAMDPTDELAQELVRQFERNDTWMMIVLVCFGLLLTLVLTAYGIVITHKVAGPLHKVRLHLDKIRDGKLGTVYNLRKGDELVEFFEHFKAAHDKLREQAEADAELLDKAIDKLGATPLADELRAARDRKRESLK